MKSAETKAKRNRDNFWNTVSIPYEDRELALWMKIIFGFIWAISILNGILYGAPVSYLLVKNHSMKGYSLLIRKALTHIDSDLTADLSLKSLAELLGVNSSYLSTLFKKETGSTLTEYVNRKRVEHAIFLLNSTNLQIQEIAAACGIPDVNYFTKIFKKQVGNTPKEYREKIF